MRVSKWSNSLADALGLEAGNRLEVVSADPAQLVVAKDESRLHAVERMRARTLPIPDDYAFDRDEANAR